MTLSETLTSETDLATVESWTEYLVDIEQRLGPYFARSEAHQRAMTYVQGLLSPAEQKNNWQLAEAMGYATPYGFQNLLGRASWAADAVRDELQQYVRDYLADPEAILIIDETGFLKKGQASVGAARQYSGQRAGSKTVQTGVFLAYAGERGQTLIDRYGDDHRLRLWLEEHSHPYVLAVSGKAYVWIGMRQYAIKELLATLPDEGWTRLSAGDGAKGPRWYEWYLVPLNRPLQDSWRRWVLVRRNPADPTELRAFLVFALKLLLCLTWSR